MSRHLNPVVHVTKDGDEIPLEINLKSESHYLTAEVNETNDYVYLSFSSRIAMYDFARSLLHEAIYGESESIEFYPLADDKELHIVNGARLSLKSSRIFIDCPLDKD